jgi:hypothetical protein
MWNNMVLESYLMAMILPSDRKQYFLLPFVTDFKSLRFDANRLIGSSVLTAPELHALQKGFSLYRHCQSQQSP